MDKRGIEFFGSTVVIWIFRFISVVFILAVIFNFSLMELGIIQNVKEAETNMIASTLLSNPNGITYVSNNRIYPGVVDCDKFNADVINKTYNQGKENFIAMNLTLYNFTNGVIKNVMYNENYYHTWSTLAKTNLFGSQSTFLVERKVYVTLRNCKGNKQGLLNIKIVRPRE